MEITEDKMIGLDFPEKELGGIGTHNESSHPEFTCGNMFVRPNFLRKKGWMCGNHTHNFDHMTLVMRGSVHITATFPDGKVIEKDFYAPNSEGWTEESDSWFLVKAEVKHQIIALEDDTVFYCCYSHRDPQGRISIEKTGWGPAYV